MEGPSSMRDTSEEHIRQQGNKGARTSGKAQIRRSQDEEVAAAEINLQITEAEEQQDEQIRGPARVENGRMPREPQGEAKRPRSSLLDGENSQESKKI